MKTKEKFILHDHNKDGLDRRGFPEGLPWSDCREHSVLQCVPLQGQACFRCLCVLGHRMENSTTFGNNYPGCQADMAVNATPELFSLSGDTISKLKI
jgi:hypothetical protein